jgi:PLP dependent protein
VIADRVAAVRERITRAAERAGRRADEVMLVAVSKTQPATAVREAFAAGVREFGENRVQEAEPKVSELESLRASGLGWHLVGHLQGNKARKAASLFDRIHSLDGAELARRLDRAGSEQGVRVRSLVQVDLAGEPTKHGITEAALFPFLETLRSLERLEVQGLMVLPPYFADPEQSRPYFRKLRVLRDAAMGRSLLAGAELSMGMSHDLEVAIEEGATLVRVGTAVFGPRPKG